MHPANHAELRTRRSSQRGSVVITGASAGVGRATALAFARRGWRVALLARGGLEGAKLEVEAVGGEVLAISVDVADPQAVFTAAEQIVLEWGTIDVWVNNAMVTMFAPVAEITWQEFRRLTEVTYLGYVYGTMAALKHMRVRNSGTIVQVGSALSYRAIPLQSAYCGAKFAIRGFTDSLRSELLHEDSKIRVTMVQLPAANTPQFNWARNKMPTRPQPLPPIYQPEAIAEAIFRASQQAPRELWVGLVSVRAILGTMVVSGLLDRLLARKGYDGQLTSEPRAADDVDNIFQPAPKGHATHGRFDRRASNKVAAVSAALVRATIASVAILIIAVLALLLYSA